MANIEARLTLSAIDRASAVINRVGASMRAVNAHSLAAARQGLSKFTSATAHLAIPTALAARSFFTTAVGFDRIRNSAQAAGELTEEQIARFEEAAKVASRELKVLPSQAMDAVKVLVKAGYSYEQTLGMLKPSLEGAIAGMGEFGSEAIEVAQSTELAAGIVAGLRLPMKTTEESLKSLTLVNDVVAKSANLSQANFREMGVAFKYAAPLASLTGNNIFELGAAFTVMAKANIKADEAGVAVRSGIVRMLKPTKSMQAALKRLNIDLQDFVERGKNADVQSLEKTFAAHGYDVSGVRKKLKSLFADEDLQNDSAAFFEKVTATIAEGLGDESVLGKEKISDVLTEYLASLGGKVKLVEFFEALRKNGAKASDLVNIFDVRQGGRLATMLSPELKETVARLEKEAGGAATKMAKTMMKGAVGSLENLQSSWANFMIAIARSGVLDRVAAIMDRFAAAFDRMGKADPVVIERIVTGLVALSIAAPALVAVSTAVRLVAGAVGVLATVAGAALVPVVRLVAAFRTLRNAMLITYGIGGFRAVLASMGGGLSAIAAGAIAALNPLRWLRGAFMLLRVATGPVGLVFTAIAGALTFLYQNWQGFGAMFSGIAEGFRAAAPPEVVAVFEKFGSIIGSIFNAIGGLASRLQISNEAWQQFGKVIGGGLAVSVEGIASAIRAIASAAEWAANKVGALMNSLSQLPGAVKNMTGGNAVRPQNGSLYPKNLGSSGGGDGPWSPDGARAGGGDVAAGHTYRINERGQEFFTPSRSGRIIPNHRLGGGVTVHAPITLNITAGGANAGEIVRMAKARMREELAAALRGAIADTGMA